jgi:hypothetical protein
VDFDLAGFHLLQRGASGLEAHRRRSRAPGGLRRGVACHLARAGNDSALLEQFESAFGDLIRKLPHEARSEIDDPFLKAAVDGDYTRVAGLASTYLTARLANEGA